MNQVSPMQLLMVSLLLAFVPMIIATATSYLKLSIVIGMLKNALGTQQAPSALIVMVLSFTLSIFIMTPTIKSIFNKIAENTFESQELTPSYLLAKGRSILNPWCNFLEKHGEINEKKLFSLLASQISKKELKLSDSSCFENINIYFPAFVLSELKEGFAMAFTLLLPFLVIDLVIANILVGLGMFMVSPIMISLPVKLILFVLADGWILLSKGLVLSYS